MNRRGFIQSVIAAVSAAFLPVPAVAESTVPEGMRDWIKEDSIVRCHKDFFIWSTNYCGNRGEMRWCTRLIENGDRGWVNVYTVDHVDYEHIDQHEYIEQKFEQYVAYYEDPAKWRPNGPAYNQHADLKRIRYEWREAWDVDTASTLPNFALVQHREPI